MFKYECKMTWSEVQFIRHVKSLGKVLKSLESKIMHEKIHRLMSLAINVHIKNWSEKIN